MLPILRVIPVGGVLLAIAILLLALNPPGGSRVHLMPARGVLIPSEQHPEWPQLLMHAALRRADELKRLRELPDTPVRIAPAAKPPAKAEKAPSVAAVPATPKAAEPDDVTGTIAQSPDAAIPVDIGETSSTELPVTRQDERPPVIMTPRRARPAPDSGSAAPEPATPQPKRSTRRPPRAKPAANQDTSAQFNLFGALFEPH